MYKSYTLIKVLKKKSNCITTLSLKKTKKQKRKQQPEIHLKLIQLLHVMKVLVLHHNQEAPLGLRVFALLWQGGLRKI